MLAILFSFNVNASECVILLHGLARSDTSMEALSEALDKAGFIPVNYNYPSRHFTIEQLAESSINQAIDQCPPESTKHFVTHSMGGILVRQYLQTHELDE